MSLSCRLPAEWEPQTGVLLTWPHTMSDWQSSLDRVEPVFIRLAREIAAREMLLVNCYDDDHRYYIQKLLNRHSVNTAHVRLHVCPSNDSWARDHGPVTVLENSQAHMLDFTFNGWGNKYPSKLDNAITRQMAANGLFGQTQLSTVDLVMEGGSLETDGAGTLLTTRRCLLHPQRNPQLNQKQIEQKLGEWLGIKHFLWLESGALEGDDTDGHIDMLARFVDPDTIIYQQCSDTAYPHFDELNRMKFELTNFLRPDGNHYQLVALPWPAAQVNSAGEHLPVSYANFLVINGAVLVPAYADTADDTARELLQSVFPEHDVVSIDCRPLIAQSGSLHCVTMQLPAAVDIQML